MVLAGTLWNLSSYEPLKMVIIDHGLQTLTHEVIVPNSGWEPEPNEDSKPRDAEWTTVFKNTSGCLRCGPSRLPGLFPAQETGPRRPAGLCPGDIPVSRITCKAAGHPGLGLRAGHSTCRGPRTGLLCTSVSLHVALPQPGGELELADPGPLGPDCPSG